MNYRLLSLLAALLAITTAALLSCSPVSEPELSQAEKPGGPPALVIDQDAPLLLDEPGETERPAVAAAPAALGENTACFVCHANYQAEPLAKQHAGADVGCVSCHGPVRHVATALVLPPGADAAAFLEEEIDPVLCRRAEKAAEDIVVAYEVSRGWECERVGHLKIGFDVRSLGPADPQTGYRDPVSGIRRIEVKGRTHGQAIRMTTNEWYKAAQLSDTYWLYVVWDPLDNPNPEPLCIQNPVKRLDHAKREVIVARYFDIPSEAIEQASVGDKP
jgi:hypothetical protein